MHGENMKLIVDDIQNTFFTQNIYTNISETE